MPKATLARSEARKLGCRQYYEKELCANGHRAPRLVSSGKCVECRKRIAAANFKANKKKITARQKKGNGTVARLEAKSRARCRVKARELTAVKEADKAEDTFNMPSRVAQIKRRPLKKLKKETTQEYVKRQVARIRIMEGDIRTYIGNLKLIVEFTTMCHQRDMEALIKELEGRYPAGPQRLKVCPFCQKKKTFLRDAWFDRHHCKGAIAFEKVVDRLICEREERLKAGIDFF